MRSYKVTWGLLAAVALGVLAEAASAQITIATVPVGNPGNGADTLVMPDGTTGYGSVSYSYNIGKYDVTIGQYAAFLNAVAATDTNSLWNSNMTPGAALPTSGITRTGSSGSYAYAATNPNFPVTSVTFWDACRFANWLQNGQPTGSQNAGTTENGTYDLTNPANITNNTATRNAGAAWAVTSENEWYKAAYYDPSLSGGSGGYWLYPTRSNTAPGNSLALAATTPNEANYYISGYTDPVNYLTAVGAFAASPSAYGTYDQGGDVLQWNESIIIGSDRGLRGGAFNDDADVYLQSRSRYLSYPASVSNKIGFRVSQVPEPASLGILAFGVAALLARLRQPQEQI
jgi:formylglycine-generating enzyme required for sulfatase activity